jgi:2-hydroxy-3-keto-5-methylthiopentenyl-1-phosphate phosphatase
MGSKRFIFWQRLGTAGNIKYIFGRLLASNLQREFADATTLDAGQRKHLYAADSIEKMRKIFISDYDGTITDKDFYSLLAERYIPADTPDYFGQYREGRMTHFDAMAAYFAFAPTEEKKLERLLEASQADPDLGASAARLQRAGWELVVVSAGSSWYVERVLSQAGVTATIYSNPGRIENGRGLVLEKLDPSSPYHSASVGVDKSAVVRQALSVTQKVAFAGDGPPDLQPALLVRPELRFARGFLADALRQRREAFRPFSRWSEIVRELV